MAVTRPTTDDVNGWAGELDRLGERLGHLFARSEPRRRALGYLKALCGDAERKNAWQVAEYLGEPDPTGVQHLLGRASWDADGLRDELSRYARDHLHDARGVLVIDETGFLKKGEKSAGVQRQYSGTAGRIENCQVGVFLAFAGKCGRALIDRELYLPEVWADPDRRREAKVPEGVDFATKPRLAERMLSRAWASGWEVPWVTADEVYGNDTEFRRFLERNHQPYVLAVKCDLRLFDGSTRRRADEIASGLPAGSWRRASAGEGAKGPREYDWSVRAFGGVGEDGSRLWLLVRRHPGRSDERAYYLCRGPSRTARRELVRVAGARWAVEECFQRAKKECGLDHYEVRSWVGWYRHVTLSMLALAMLGVIRARVVAESKRGAG